MHEEDWCAVREIYQEGIATGNATFQTAAPEWLEWNEGHLQTAATSPLLITEWWDGLRYLLFPAGMHTAVSQS
jgi:phosphinothricin acetyltransferase